MFKWYLARVEKEIGKSMKFLRSNKGGKMSFRYFIMIEQSKDRHLLLGPLHKMESLKGGTDM